MIHSHLIKKYSPGIDTSLPGRRTGQHEYCKVTGTSHRKELKVGGASEITTGNQPLTFNLNGTTELSAYIITFGFDAIPEAVQDSWLRLGGSEGCGIGTSSATTMVLRTGRTAGTSIDNTTLTINTEDTFALTFSVDTVYLSNLTDGTYVSKTIAADDVNRWKLTSETDRIWTNNATNKLQVGQVADLTGLTREQVLSVVKTGIIPEPATATLSLLALAGLAARRRRK